MTIATSARVKTEFLVSQDTSSKDLFYQLSELTTGKGQNADLPIRAYDEGRKGITLKIYNKKTSAGGIVKAAANPQRVSARVLVIKTIEKILTSELEKSNSQEEKETINKVLGNIKAKKSHCINHDIKVPNLITDLRKLEPIWNKTSDSNKPAETISSTRAQQSQKTESPKETNAGKSKPLKTTEKTKLQEKAETKPTNTKNKTPESRSEKLNLRTKKADFDLSNAINFLAKIKKYGESFDIESNSKARIRVGEIKKTDELSFYISTKVDRKTKKKDSALEGRKVENKNLTTKRAITMMRVIANSLVDQKKLSDKEVNEVFSMIEKHGYISVNDASTLLDLLETGRRAAYVLPAIVQADSNDTLDTPLIPNINTNPVDETLIQGSRPKSMPPPLTVSTTSIPSTPDEKITNRVDDAIAKEPQAPTPVQVPATAPPSFFQRVADYFKPITNFFSSVRRFFGFN